jgi:hypothetical protein
VHLVSENALQVFPLDDRGSFAWMVGPSDPASRTSAALVVPAGTLLIDPVDSPELDGRLASLPPVVGVVTLLDRHQRDAAALAQRLGVPRLTPRALGGPGVNMEGVEERAVIESRRWREALLWLPDRKLLVCAEVLGTARYLLARRGDRLGMHPIARLRPPKAAFQGIDPATIAVGHGPPLREGASAALEHVLRTGRRELPLNWARVLSEAVRVWRAARRARR